MGQGPSTQTPKDPKQNGSPTITEEMLFLQQQTAYWEKRLRFSISNKIKDNIKAHLSKIKQLQVPPIISQALSQFTTENETLKKTVDIAFLTQAISEREKAKEAKEIQHRNNMSSLMNALELGSGEILKQRETIIQKEKLLQDNSEQIKSLNRKKGAWENAKANTSGEYQKAIEKHIGRIDQLIEEIKKDRVLILDDKPSSRPVNEAFNQIIILEQLLQKYLTEIQNLSAERDEWLLEKNSEDQITNKLIDDYLNKIDDFKGRIQSVIEGNLNAAPDDEAIPYRNAQLDLDIREFKKNEITLKANFKAVKNLIQAKNHWESKRNTPGYPSDAIDKYIKRIDDCMKVIAENFTNAQQPAEIQQIEAAINRNSQDIESLKVLCHFWSQQPETDRVKRHLINMYNMIEMLENNNRNIFYLSVKEPVQVGEWENGYKACQEGMVALRTADISLKAGITSNAEMLIGIADRIASSEDRKAFPMSVTGDRTSEENADSFATSDKNYENELFRSKSGTRTVSYNGKIVNNLAELRGEISKDEGQAFEEVLKYSHVNMQDSAGPFIQNSAQLSKVTARASHISFQKTADGFLFESTFQGYSFHSNTSPEEGTLPGTVYSVYEYKNSEKGFRLRGIYATSPYVQSVIMAEKNTFKISAEDLEKAHAQENYQREINRLKALTLILQDSFPLKRIVEWIYNKLNTLATKHSNIADFNLLAQVATRIVDLSSELLKQQAAAVPASPTPLAASVVSEQTKLNPAKALEESQYLINEVHDKYDPALAVELIVFFIAIGVALSFTGVGAFFGLAFLEFAVEAAIPLITAGLGTFALSGFLTKDIRDSRKEAELALRTATSKPLISSPSASGKPQPQPQPQPQQEPQYRKDLK